MLAFIFLVVFHVYTLSKMKRQRDPKQEHTTNPAASFHSPLTSQFQPYQHRVKKIDIKRLDIILGTALKQCQALNVIK